MKSRVAGRFAIAVSLAFALALCAWPVLVAQEPPPAPPAQPAAPAAPAAAGSTLSKPLAQFSIGDIFPKLINEGFAETGKQWGASAGDFTKMATTRKQNVSTAIAAKEAEIPGLKSQLSAAKKENDLVKVGTLEGTIKNEEDITQVLKGFNKVSDAQIELANRWRAAGEAMEKFTAADIKFDQFRAKKLSRPEAGQPDERLNAEGTAAFQAHTQALKELGMAFSALGAGSEKMAAGRQKLLDTLAKGGNVQAPPK